MRAATLAVEIVDSIVYAALCGDIDLSNASDLRTEISALTPNDASGLVLDLSGADYLDSAGIQLVHRLRQDLRASGQRLRIVIPSASPVNATLRLAGLDWAHETFETVDAARSALLADHT